MQESGGMYLRECLLENVGPLECVDLSLPFNNKCSRNLRSSAGRLVLLFAYHQNWAVSVPDDAVGYTPHERSSYSTKTTAAHRPGMGMTSKPSSKWWR